VACLWAGTATGGRVLPDGCADVVWAGGALMVAGPATAAAHPGLAPGGTTLGVRFLTGAAGAALGLPAHELLDRTVPLAELWGDEAERLSDALAAAAGPRAALDLLTAAVGERLIRAQPVDPLVRGAVLAAAERPRSVAQLARASGLGERQLRRRFAAAVGYGPATLARVARFQRFLALARGEAEGGARLARLAAAAGYADQAHLARECARLGAMTPRALLAGGARPAGEVSARR
jgi:methylphosphotriester-DNA--protein-cysteine methyltransferase